MKTTEFIKESIDRPEYNDEVGMVKNNLHTLVRTSVELAKSLQGNENLPEWCQEKIAVAKSMIVAVGDYMISQHEMGQQPEIDSFDIDRAFAEAMDEAQFGTPGNPELSVKGTKSITPIQGDKVEIKFGYNDYYDTHVTRGEVLQIRPDGMAVVGIDKTGKTEKFPLKSLKVIGPRGYVAGPKDPTYGTPANPELSVKGVTETADVKYGVFSKGGSIGSQKFKDEPLKTFDSKEEAIADARRRRSSLSKGERGYYRMGYVVKAIKGVSEDDQQLNLFPRNAMPVHEYLAKNLDEMNQVCWQEAQEIQDRMGRDTARSDWLWEASEELDDLTRGFKNSLESGINVITEMKQNNPKMLRWIIKGIKHFTEGEIDLPVMIQQELANKKKGVAEAGMSDQHKENHLKAVRAYQAKKKAEKEQRSADSKAAFGSMFGGGPADLTKNLKIRESGKLKEDATGGGTGSSSVAVTMQTLGEKGAFSKKEINKKLGGYTNQLTSGGPVKIGKAK
jgi:hypothetical protein